MMAIEPSTIATIIFLRSAGFLASTNAIILHLSSSLILRWRRRLYRFADAITPIVRGHIIFKTDERRTLLLRRRGLPFGSSRSGKRSSSRSGCERICIGSPFKLYFIDNDELTARFDVSEEMA